MGVQDRDWYWKDRDAKAKAEREAQTPPSDSEKVRRDPDAMIRRVNRSGPPSLWGADWHWTLQLLVWLCIAVLLLITWRLVR